MEFGNLKNIIFFNLKAKEGPIEANEIQINIEKYIAKFVQRLLQTNETVGNIINNLNEEPVIEAKCLA